MDPYNARTLEALQQAASLLQDFMTGRRTEETVENIPQSSATVPINAAGASSSLGSSGAPLSNLECALSPSYVADSSSPAANIGGAPSSANANAHSDLETEDHQPSLTSTLGNSASPRIAYFNPGMEGNATSLDGSNSMQYGHVQTFRGESNRGMLYTPTQSPSYFNSPTRNIYLRPSGFGHTDQNLGSCERVGLQQNQFVTALGQRGTCLPSTSSANSTSFQLQPGVGSPSTIYNSRTASIENHGPNAISEMRRLFEPYARPARCQGGATRTNRSRNNSNTSGERFINLTTTCLGYWDESVSPNKQRAAVLKENGLGISIITLRSGATTFDVETALRNVYPKLRQCSFELLKASGGGYRKFLVRISQLDAVPSAIYLARLHNIYVRPVKTLVPEENFDELERSTQIEEPRGNSQNMMGAQRDTSSFDDIANRYRTPIREGRLPTRSSAGCSSLTSTNADRGGFRFDLGDDLGNLRNESEFVTILELRSHLFEENPDHQYILVHRTSLLEDLLGIYIKDPSFNFKKKTNVKFVGEAGRDINALTKEFFWLAMQSLKTEKLNGSHALFEGEADFLVPSRDTMLRSSGYFRLLGKFIAHSAIHVGVGFVGLSLAVIKYIFRPNDDYPIVLTSSDLPDYDLRQVFMQMSNWRNGSAPDETWKNHINQALQSANIYDVPTVSNMELLLQQFSQWCVFDSRSTCLKEIKDGMKETGFFGFLQSREYLWETIFPRESSFVLSSESVVASIWYDGAPHNNIKLTLEQFIHQLDPPKLRDFLHCWTGWPSIPSEGLKVKVVEEDHFEVHACFSEMEIGRNLSPSQLLNFLQLLVNDGVYGFGLV